jgi:type II secretory pathway component PulF
MATTSYKYEAKDAKGKTVKGTVRAGSANEATADLRRRSLVPINVQDRGGSSFFSMSLGGPKVAKKASVAKGELETFTRQLSTMLSAGIPMLEALEILAEQAESPGFRFCLNKVVDDIRNGGDLSKAMEPHKKVFSDIYVSMIRAGEVSGQIDIILTRLAEYLEAAAHLRLRDQVGDDLSGRVAVPRARHRRVPDDRHRAVVQAGVRVAGGRAARPDGVIMDIAFFDA